MNKQDIINLLNTNDRAIGRALVAINERQTDSEKDNLGTISNNGKGFTPADAYMGTSMANYFVKFDKLSEKQIAYWRKPNAKGIPRINKYATQLLDHAINKARKLAIEDDNEMNRIVREAEMESECRSYEREMYWKK